MCAALVSIESTSSSAALRRVRLFVRGAGEGASSGNLSCEGVWLLKRCPAARDAVLEYFARVFHEAVDAHRRDPQNENGPNNASMESVSIITNALCDLEAPWAQILAPWSINLLKDIASSHKTCSAPVLQNCEAVRCLLNVVTVCLSRLDGNDRVDCIDSMLSTSQCEWVVGHIGRCDPSLVVPRALELALQKQSSQNIDHVVTILAHLSPLHFGQIRQALLDMFEDSLIVESGDNERRKAIIPYLMQLASKSDVVLKALTKDINITSSTEMLDKLLKICTTSIPGFDSGSTRGAIVALCLRAQAPVFLLLLNWAPKNLTCSELLENLLQKMEGDVRSCEGKIQLLDSVASDITNIRRKLLNGSVLEKYAIARVTILISCQSSSIFINTVSYLLQNSQDDKTLAILVRIVSGTLSMRATLDASEQSDNTLTIVRQAHENALREAMNAQSYSEIFQEVDEKSSNRETCLERYCYNIATLLRWEKLNKIVYLQNKPITKVSEMNLLKLACAFFEQVSDVSYSCFGNSLENANRLNSMSICHSMAAMIDLIEIPSSQNIPISVEILMKITRANVKYFFRCLHETDIIKQFKGSQTAYRIFRRTCAGSKVARSVALREILETALFREAEIFGSITKEGLDNNANFEKSRDELLMFQNHKQGPLTQLTQSHTSVFHAGIIGKGARKPIKEETKEVQLKNSNTATLSKSSREVELLLGALMSCMEDNGVSLEAMTSVSLLLVELVSPDVMYNGLPWPDEDFTKVSIERELYIRQVFDGYPLVWHIIRLISCFRPALCYCSVLLRAVVATLIHQYSAKSGSDDGNLNEITIQLLDIMCRGQLLPTPLNYISKMIPHLKPIEIVQILRDCVWNYTRDIVPSPELFSCDASGLHWRDPSLSKPPPQYTDTLRVLIQKKIANLGHLYPLMFLNTDTP